MVIDAEALEIKPELVTKEGLLDVVCLRPRESLTLIGHATAVQEVKGVLTCENRLTNVFVVGGHA